MRYSLLMASALMLSAAQTVWAGGPAGVRDWTVHASVTPPVIGVVRDSTGAPLSEVNVIIPD